MHGTDGDMFGVRILVEGAPEPPGSYFAAFFRPVLPRLGNLTWLLGGDAIRPPVDLPDAESAAFWAQLQWVAADGTEDGSSIDAHHVAGPGFVPKYAEWVSSDWSYICGFERPPTDWREWLRARYGFERWPTDLLELLQAAQRTGPRWQSERAAFLAATTEVCFFAVDYAYWEFFAHDAALVRIASDAAATAGLVVWPAKLSESVGL